MICDMFYVGIELNKIDKLCLCYLLYRQLILFVSKLHTFTLRHLYIRGYNRFKQRTTE